MNPLERAQLTRDRVAAAVARQLEESVRKAAWRSLPLRKNRTLPRPRVEQLDDGENWLLVEDYVVTSHREEMPDLVTPAGYIVDGASVPTPFHWYIRPAGPAFRASIPHDGGFGLHTEAFAYLNDQFYYDLIASSGYRTTKCWNAYQMVSWFGSRPYNSGPKRWAERQARWKDVLEEEGLWLSPTA